jgi:iron(III) transport system ATP-binding protein
MARLSLENVTHRYEKGGVADISFAVEQGQVACLVGASGSGKTTILKLIAGFLRPQEGVIHIGSRDVASPKNMLEPQKRGVGLVFQQHALFPHLTVAENILFGCTESGHARQAMLQKLLKDFHIEPYGKRYPHEISGGEQQRVALARALAASPQAMLMDEPFASIDSALRRKLRNECIDVLRQNGVTTLMVTHDAEEAMELADRIFVLEHGELAQSGSPQEIYNHPVSASVAALFGDINPISDPSLLAQLGAPTGKELLLRPETLCLNESGLPGQVTQAHFRGSHFLLHVRTPEGAILKVRSVKAPQKGARVSLRLVKVD